MALEKFVYGILKKIGEVDSPEKIELLTKELSVGFEEFVGRLRKKINKSKSWEEVEIIIIDTNSSLKRNLRYSEHQTKDFWTQLSQTINSRHIQNLLKEAKPLRD